MSGIEKLRAWWWHRQGLDGGLEGSSPAEVLAGTGWARSVGGAAPYLTLFARAGTSREAADAAVAALDVHELPAARGCTYVVPATDFALALRAGAGGNDAEMKIAAKLGVTEKETDKLCEAVKMALEKGPLDPEGIREATGKAARSLGEEGKKKGLSTTLPLALGELQSSGEIRRVSMNGRIDQQRFRYTLWKPNPLAKFKLSGEEVNIELARRYFSWIGPASIAEFQWFSAFNAKTAKAAMEPLKLVKMEEDRWMLPGDREAFESFRVSKQARYALVSSADGMALLRRDLKSLVDAADWNRKIFGGKGLLADLPAHAIFDRGRLVGLWLYDPETESIAWTAFVEKSKDLRAAVARTEEFVRSQLGDARSFSLDSPKSRAPQIAAMRAAK